jgi:hypothetical protein
MALGYSIGALFAVLFPFVMLVMKPRQRLGDVVRRAAGGCRRECRSVR